MGSAPGYSIDDVSPKADKGIECREPMITVSRAYCDAAGEIPGDPKTARRVDLSVNTVKFGNKTLQSMVPRISNKLNSISTILLSYGDTGSVN